MPLGCVIDRVSVTMGGGRSDMASPPIRWPSWAETVAPVRVAATPNPWCFRPWRRFGKFSHRSASSRNLRSVSSTSRRSWTASWSRTGSGSPAGRWKPGWAAPLGAAVAARSADCRLPDHGGRRHHLEAIPGWLIVKSLIAVGNMIDETTLTTTDLESAATSH
jgi:hypothetical protein